MSEIFSFDIAQTFLSAGYRDFLVARPHGTGMSRELAGWKTCATGSSSALCARDEIWGGEAAHALPGFGSPSTILLFIAPVLARFTYAEKLTVMFWFFAIFSGIGFFSVGGGGVSLRLSRAW